VEENAATSRTLEHQAKAMDERVAAFRVGAVRAAAAAVPVQRQVAGAARAPVAAKSQPSSAPKRARVVAPTRAAAVSTGRGPVARMQATIAAASNVNDDWKEF
jgi:hypothetical protein